MATEKRTEPEQSRGGSGRLTEAEAWEDIRRIAWALKEPKWWKTLVKKPKDAEFVLALAEEAGYKPVEPGYEEKLEKLRKFMEGLEEGLYLRRLETAPIPWSDEQVARDLWQNFFDATGYTLDGVTIETTPAETPDKLRVRIQGPAEFDPRRLLHFGATSKIEDEQAVGRYGVGSKDAAFVLLRDHGVGEVVFGTGSWVVNFYLDRVPEGEHEDPETRGLYARAQPQTERQGSFVEFTVSEPMAQTMIEAKDFFYHSENPALQKPNVENSKVWVKVHPDESGGLYPNGQFVPFGAKGLWVPNLPDLTIYSKVEVHTEGGQCLELSQDRDIVTRSELQESVLPFIAENTTTEEKLALLEALRDFWDYDTDRWSHGEAVYLLDALIRELAKRRFRLEDHLDTSNLVAASDKIPELNSHLEEAGYEVCHSSFAGVGIPDAKRFYNELVSLQEVVPTPEEERRISILTTFTQRLLETTASDYEKMMRLLGEELDKLPLRDRVTLDKPLEALPIKLFEKESPLTGRYGGDFVWLRRETTRGDFSAAIAVYLHELCHKYGGDFDSLPFYALTDLLQRYDTFRTKYPQEYERFRKEWESAIQELPSTQPKAPRRR